MPIDRNLIKCAMLDFQAYGSSCHDQWLTLSAWKAIFYKCYDFGNKVDFTDDDLAKALLLLSSATYTVNIMETQQGFTSKKMPSASPVAHRSYSFHPTLESNQNSQQEPENGGHYLNSLMA